MGETLRSIIQKLLIKAGLKAHIVDLILGQVQWAQLRPDLVSLLRRLAEEYVYNLEHSGWTPEDGYEMPINLWNNLMGDVRGRVPMQGPTLQQGQHLSPHLPRPHLSRCPSSLSRLRPHQLRRPSRRPRSLKPHQSRRRSRLPRPPSRRPRPRPPSRRSRPPSRLWLPCHLPR